MIYEKMPNDFDSAFEVVSCFVEHHDKIPRTTLRYAIERFDVKERKDCLRGEIWK